MILEDTVLHRLKVDAKQPTAASLKAILTEQGRDYGRNLEWFSVEELEVGRYIAHSMGIIDP
jgi:hypothetical protein